MPEGPSTQQGQRRQAMEALPLAEPTTRGPRSPPHTKGLQGPEVGARPNRRQSGRRQEPRWGATISTDQYRVKLGRHPRSSHRSASGPVPHRPEAQAAPCLEGYHRGPLSRRMGLGRRDTCPHGHSAPVARIATPRRGPSDGQHESARIAPPDDLNCPDPLAMIPSVRDTLDSAAPRAQSL